MIGFTFFFFGILSVIGLCAMAAWTDFKGFRIPNIISVIIIAAFALAYLVTHITGQDKIIFLSLTSHLAACVIVFGVTSLLFAVRILGAGDSKLMSAIALWLGLSGLIPFLFYMSLIGGLLGGASLLLKRFKPLKLPLPKIFAGSWLENAQAGTNKVPYGIAIAAGTLISFFFIGYFDPEKWALMINL